MAKTILITGASSGIGKAIAVHFADKGWNVAATMRHPENETDLAGRSGVKLYRLDVTDNNSIRQSMADTIQDFNRIDVVVNNAGYGAIGIFEKTTKEQIQRQFDINVFGVMNVTRFILSHFRKQRNGVIINITSMGGLITFPIYSVYHATKWAVEGFSESLQYELRPFNIKVKLVEPGAIKTDFYSRSQELFANDAFQDYDEYEKVTFKNTQKTGGAAPGPETVAKTVYKAANDHTFKLRYPVGGQTAALLTLRRFIPNKWFNSVVRSEVEKGFKG